MTCEALSLQLLGGDFKKCFSRIADLYTWDGDPCPGTGKGSFFFQVDLVGSQDSVDVMAVCWLRISDADVPLPTKSGASNHLRTLLCRTTTCFFLFCFAGFTMFFLYFS